VTSNGSASGALTDKAGQGYWDSVWDSGSAERRHWLYPTAQVAAWMERELGAARAASVVEVGAANSSWLPYLARNPALAVAGLDYSEEGCARARERLDEAGVSAEIVCADLFDPPAEMLGRFDAVFTYGVIEHFEDTTGCARAFGALLAPGGVTLTLVPNFAGWMGKLQAFLSRPVYDKHVPLSAADLERAHREAGLEVLRSEHLVAFNSGVCNLNEIPTGTAAYFGKRNLLRALNVLSRVAWKLEARGWLRPNRRTSPYVVCVARRPEA
jgi:2-polyprenyl-3-methyl-5-hydroxy-6-metoxy-1,4-benzoquinol methylase